MDQEKILNLYVYTVNICFNNPYHIVPEKYNVLYDLLQKKLSFRSFYVRNLIFKGGYIPCALQLTIYAPVRLGLSNQVVL